MTQVFVFPGQGSQAVGMGRALHDTFSDARAVFEEVDDALSQKLSHVIFEGPMSTLTLTENAQPALMAVSLAVMRVLVRQGGFDVSRLKIMAGHSLGEYSALSAAGAISVAEAACLLKIRGCAMQEAVPVGEGAMVAVLGLDISTVERVVQEFNGCVIANDNAPGQVVLSGVKSVVEATTVAMQSAGAKRCIPLVVSAPFHSPLMTSAAEAMRVALEDVEFLAPVVPIIPNVTAAPTEDALVLKDLLVQQVTGRVRWRETLLFFPTLGVDSAIEIGAGKVLSGLAKKTIPALVTSSISTPEDIEEFLETL